MSKLVSTVTMTVDGVTDVGAWYVAEGGHDRASREQFDGAAGMVIVGRRTKGSRRLADAGGLLR